MSNRIPITATFGPDDRPRAPTVIVVLVALAATGYALTRASLEDVRDAEPTESTPSVEAPVVAPAPAPATPDAAVTAPQPEPVVAATPIEEPATAEPAAPATGVGTLARGRIAYIRCDGVEDPTAPNPCPRDSAMERTVWAAIERLPGCPALAGQRGTADVRVVFDDGIVTGLGFRDIEPPLLDRDAVRGCLEPMLEGARTTRPGARMTASFRFDIR